MALPSETEARKNADFVRKWVNEINDAREREKTFRKEAVKAVRIYEASDDQQTEFAILYSNTETLAPALYSAVPIPLVKRRFDDADPLGKVSAEVIQRSLKYLIEAESATEDSFDELMHGAVLDALLTNRGLTRERYIAEGSHECVYTELVRWDKFLHGFARTWKKVPWVAFQHDMGAEELKKLSPTLGPRISLTSMEAQAEREQDPATGQTPADQLKGVSSTPVYEIWDKASRKVFFICPAYPDAPMKGPVDDPLGLSGFFPIPRPLNLMRKVSTLIPTPLYVQYERQAKELNELTARLRHLIKALKIRGFYNSTVEEIEKVLEADENVLIPVTNMESMPDGSGADKLIWLMPIETLSTVIVQLYQQREQCKSVIYEITGISDILRGSSRASESATAQNIKREFGSMRIQKFQKEIQRYCRDVLRIKAEIAVEQFSPETFAAMTSLKLPSAEEKAQAQSAMQMQQMQAQAMPQQQPTPPDSKIVAILALPSWEEVVQLLKDQISRTYRIDIETNSTIEAEAASDKKDIAELLAALSQFMNGVAPLIKEGVMPFEVAKQMLLAITRRYTFGSQLEDALDKMTPPPAPGPDPADEAKAELVQLQVQAAKQKAQIDSEKSQSELAADKERMQMERQVAMMELQVKQAELQLKQQEIQMQSAASMEAHQIKMTTMREQAALKAQIAKDNAAKKKDSPNATV